MYSGVASSQTQNSITTPSNRATDTQHGVPDAAAAPAQGWWISLSPARFRAFRNFAAQGLLEHLSLALQVPTI